MPNLPEIRVNQSGAFENVGFDYLGPLSIKTKGGISKRWIALFTCFITRAIHLEIADNLPAETFLHVLRRFISRREYPERVLNDNAGTAYKIDGILEKENDLGEYNSKSILEWRNLWTIDCIDKENYEKNHRKEATMGKIIHNFNRGDRSKVIRPVDFIQPNASLVIPTTNTNQDEYMPETLNARERLIKYWTATLKERTQKEDVYPKVTENRSSRVREIVLLDKHETPRSLWKLAKIKELGKGGVQELQQ
uniref:Integrase catalytic domain-containing protein n=1 Tax=Loa loa TaxID=7209 RepID=A0A1I7VUM8_LOALO